MRMQSTEYIMLFIMPFLHCDTLVSFIAKHTGMKSLFNKEFIQTGLIDKSQEDFLFSDICQAVRS